MNAVHPTADRPPTVLRRHAGAASDDPAALAGLAADDSYLVRRQAVDNPATPRWVIDLLVRAGADERLRGRSAPDPSLTAAELRRLVECGPFARELVAEHRNVDPDVLNELTTDASVTIRRSVAAHGNAPAAALGRLCADAEAPVRRTAVANPNRPDDVVRMLESAGADPSLGSVRIGPVPAVSADDCRQLAQLGPFGLFLAARNPGCPGDALAAAATDADVSVRSAVLEHPAVLPEIVERITGELVDVSVLRLGPAEALAPLARHPSAVLRLAVARSAHAVGGILRTLLTDADARVRVEASRSPFVDEVLIDQLRRAGSRDDLSGLAAPLVVTETELRELAGGGPWARLLAVRHPDAPADVLSALLADEDPKLREWAAAHPHVPSETVSLLRRAGAADDFQGVAVGDSSMPVSQLRVVAELGPYGAFVAAWHPAAPSDLRAARG